MSTRIGEERFEVVAGIGVMLECQKLGRAKVFQKLWIEETLVLWASLKVDLLKSSAQTEVR